MKISVTSTGETGSFEPLPPGEYDIVLVSTSEKKSQANNPMCRLEFQIAGKTRKVTDQIVCVESVMWKWEQLAAAYGQVAEPGQQIEIDTDSFIGRTCRAKLKIEQYTDKEGNPKEVNRIDYYIAASDGGTTEAQPAAAPATHAAPVSTAPHPDAKPEAPVEEREDSQDVPF